MGDGNLWKKLVFFGYTCVLKIIKYDKGRIHTESQKCSR